MINPGSKWSSTDFLLEDILISHGIWKCVAVHTLDCVTSLVYNAIECVKVALLTKLWKQSWALVRKLWKSWEGFELNWWIVGLIVSELICRLFLCVTASEWDYSVWARFLWWSTRACELFLVKEEPFTWFSAVSPLMALLNSHFEHKMSGS